MSKILKLLKISLIINLASLFSAFEEKCDEEPKPLTGYAATAAYYNGPRKSDTK